MVNEENRYRAQMYVERHFNEMQKKIERDGYFVYDEYETIYIHAGRFIPEILNDKLQLSEDVALSAIEEKIEGEGYCGIIVTRNMLNDRSKIVDILEKFYKKS